MCQAVWALNVTGAETPERSSLGPFFHNIHHRGQLSVLLGVPVDSLPFAIPLARRLAAIGTSRLH